MGSGSQIGFGHLRGFYVSCPNKKHGCIGYILCQVTPFGWGFHLMPITLMTLGAFIYDLGCLSMTFHTLRSLDISLLEWREKEALVLGTQRE